MRRRDLITALAAAAALPPGLARAQRSSLPLVGVIGVLSAADNGDLLAALNQGLNGMGFLDGRNVVVEPRWAEGQIDRLPPMASDLVQRRAAVALVTLSSGVAALAAKPAAGGVIPVVFAEADMDPVKAGLAASLPKPGSNYTGILLSDASLEQKRFETLQEAVPSAATVGMLVNPGGLDSQTKTSVALGAAQAVGVTLKVVNATNPDEIDAAFADKLVTAQVGALVVADDVFFLTQRDKIVAAAAANNLPAMYPNRAYVALGGLMSYAADPVDAYRKVGDYVAKILVGQKPADLPVMQASKFELVMNRKTAAGLQISASVISGANRVIDGTTTSDTSVKDLFR